MKPLIVCCTLLIETSPQALPLGAACVASAIKHHPKTKDLFDVELIAVSKEENGFADSEKQGKAAQFIADKICSKGNPDYVLFSVYVWNRQLLEEASALLKNRLPNLKTLAGGPEVTASPASFQNFDYTVSGAGEIANPELLYSLECQKNGSSVSPSDFSSSPDFAALPQGVFSSQQKNKLSAANCRAFPPELATLSSPYLDGTLDPAPYGGALWELARGCPFKCSYCYESKGEKKIQYFPLERIEKELELFNQKKLSQVFVLDPTYNANKKRAADLLRLIAKKAPGMFFYFEARAEFIDRELAQAFTRIPCALQFGLQSADPEVLKHVNRTLDKKLFTKNIGYLNDAGAIFGFDLIYGLPKDTLEGFRKSVDFALNLYPNNLETFCLSVLPGTDLADSAASLGLEYEKSAPYHVLKTDCFSAADLKKAEKISNACNYFYNNGRAVPWFNSLCHALHIRPVVLLEEFADWFQKHSDADFSCCDHQTIEKNQLGFVKMILSQRQKNQLAATTESVILFNGALSRVEADGKPQFVKLSFHPDDLASPYATDFAFFAKNCRRFPCTVQCFKNKNGNVDWKVTK